MDNAVPNREASTRITRILAVALGAGSIVFGILTLASIQKQFASCQLWWSIPTVLITFGLPITMAVTARWASARTLRRLAAITAYGYFLAMIALWPALITGHLAVSLGSPWLLQFTAIGTTAAAIAWRPGFVWTYLCMIAILVFGDRVLSNGPTFIELGAEDALYALMFTATFAMLVMICVRAGHALDAAEEQARVEAAATASAQARRQERERMEALMHDSVLSTLLTAAHDGEKFGRAAALQARTALADLEAFRNAAGQPAELRLEDFVWLLQATTTGIAADAYFTYTVDDPDNLIPGEIVQAISEALAEALRNSVRHVKPDDGETTRAVDVRGTLDLVQVVAMDDGQGFDPETVPRTRLGIAQGIVGRLARVNGGHAAVVSSADGGTRVILEWRRP